jgi:uncharacterized membrane protein YheB (UPF0754 family)
MMNVKPGSYRVPLTAGLIAIGEEELAEKVADRSIKLAVSCSIRGAVVSRSELTNRFVKALTTESARKATDEGVTVHYINKLNNGSVIPVENSEGPADNRYYASGELFFKT